MDRKEFLRSGACACALLFLRSEGTARQDPPDPGQDESAGMKDLAAEEREKAQQKFVTDWVEHLMVTLDKNLDKKSRTRILEACGRGCAGRSYESVIERHRDDLDGLLKLMKQQWAEVAEFDEDAGVIHLATVQHDGCPCPLVKGRAKLASQTYCLCSTGWMKEVFEGVTGATAEVELKETLLRGGKRCRFDISLT